MIGFVQSWFGAASSPIGVDLGSDCLRLAQVEQGDGEYKLVAAASADVPTHVRNDPGARCTFFAETVRELLGSGSFRGRRVMLNLPASLMHIQHLRLPKMDEEALKKALPWEARGKLPFDPTQAVLRHVIAGEIYQEQEQKYEIVLMAARRELVEGLLNAAARAKLEVLGMNVEPKAIVDCFTHIYRRKTDSDVTNCFVDIGCTATRVVIARGPQILFARTVAVGGEHFSRAAAAALHLNLEQAKMLRVKLASSQPPTEEQRDKRNLQTPMEASARGEASTEATGFPLLDAGMAAAGGHLERRQESSIGGGIATMTQDPPITQDAPVEGVAPADREAVERASQEPLNKLVEELKLCRRYHETTFPNLPVDRLVFVGGEARQRTLCQQIAREMGVAAQIGDPLVRMNRNSDVGIESGIDRRQPQPGWSVAVGLSIGPLVGQGAVK